MWTRPIPEHWGAGGRSWRLATVSVFETCEAAAEWAGEIEGEVLILGAGAAPEPADAGSLQAVKQVAARE